MIESGLRGSDDLIFIKGWGDKGNFRNLLANLPSNALVPGLEDQDTYSIRLPELSKFKYAVISLEMQSTVNPYSVYLAAVDENEGNSRSLFHKHGRSQQLSFQAVNQNELRSQAPTLLVGHNDPYNDILLIIVDLSITDFTNFIPKFFVRDSVLLLDSKQIIKQLDFYGTNSEAYNFFFEVDANSAGAVSTIDFPVQLSNGKTAGKYVNGQTIPGIGKTFQEIILDIVTEYLAPVFTSFVMVGQSTQLEVGESIEPNGRQITWTTSNDLNVLPNSIGINSNDRGFGFPFFANSLLALANDGDRILNFGTFLNFSSGETNLILTIRGKNTRNEDMTPRNFTVNFNYKIFFGASNAAPTDSASARALGARFTNSGNTFTLNTGNTQHIFSVIMPATRNLVSVVDQDALNANITDQYILTNFDVNDASGNPVAYKCYTMNQAVPYGANHRHLITIS